MIPPFKQPEAALQLLDPELATIIKPGKRDRHYSRETMKQLCNNGDAAPRKVRRV